MKALFRALTANSETRGKYDGGCKVGDETVVGLSFHQQPGPAEFEGGCLILSSPVGNPFKVGALYEIEIREIAEPVTVRTALEKLADRTLDELDRAQLGEEVRRERDVAIVGGHAMQGGGEF